MPAGPGIAEYWVVDLVDRVVVVHTLDGDRYVTAQSPMTTPVRCQALDVALNASADAGEEEQVRYGARRLQDPSDE